MDAAWLLLLEGQLTRAAGLRDRVAACSATRKRDLVLGMLDWEAGRADPAEAALRRAVGDEDPRVAVAALSALGMLYFTLGRGAEATATAERLLALPEVPAEDERAAWIYAALGEMLVRGAAAGLVRLAQRLPQPPDQVPPADADLLIARGALGYYAGAAQAPRSPTCGWVSDSAASPFRGRLFHAPIFSWLNCWFPQARRWDEAQLHARLAVALVDDSGLCGFKPRPMR